MVIGALHDLERIDDVVTISAIARRTGVSRPTVRTVLQQECGWTATHSRRAHHAGIHRGKLAQAVAGHPELAHGRATLQIQGWPNLQRAHKAAQASAYPALQRGRETQAAQHWPSLKAAHAALASTGYPHLAQGRANLAARGWPNWQRAQDVLKAQDYLPLLDAQRLRRNQSNEVNENETSQTPQTHPETDRRHLRGRATRLAILEALRESQAEPAVPAGGDQCALPSPRAGTRTSAAGGARRVTGRALAAQLQLHPATVYAHLKQIRQMIAQEIQEMEA
jgi:DNA-binding transcriptional ArsR family regulator